MGRFVHACTALLAGSGFTQGQAKGPAAVTGTENTLHETHFEYKDKEIIMKSIFLTALAITLFLTPSYAAEKPQLKDQKDKESYSLGYQFGRSLKQQGVSIDLDVYKSGIQDALGGTSPLLPEAEINKTVSELQTKLMAARQKAMKEQTEKNLAAGQAFLKENAKKKGVKTLPSGLQYKVVSEGKGTKPTLESTVVVNYKGTLIDGTEFDSSQRTGKPATFPVKGVIAGWTEALQLMKQGAKWQLFIPAGLAYGERGPLAGQTLLFDVELLEVK